MPDEDNNFDGRLFSLDYRKSKRHVRPKNRHCYSDFSTIYAKGLIAWLVVVFGNNAASDIFQNCPVSGIWRILNYYEPLLLQNITYRSCYYLLIMEAEKFSVTYNAWSETFISLRLKKQTRAVCIGNNIFTSTQWKEKWLTFFFIGGFSTNHWRDTTWKSSIKIISITFVVITAAVKRKLNG